MQRKAYVVEVPGGGGFLRTKHSCKGVADFADARLFYRRSDAVNADTPKGSRILEVTVSL